MRKRIHSISMCETMKIIIKKLKIGTPKIITIIVLIRILQKAVSPLERTMCNEKHFQIVGSMLGWSQILTDRSLNHGMPEAWKTKMAQSLGLHCLLKPVCPNI